MLPSLSAPDASWVRSPRFLLAFAVLALSALSLGCTGVSVVAVSPERADGAAETTVDADTQTRTVALTHRMSPPARPIGWIDRTAEAGLAELNTGCATVSFGDFDGDHDLDLFVPDETLRVLRNDGHGVFAPWINVPLPDDVASQMNGRCPQVVRDLDGDGRLDVAVATLDSRVVVGWAERDGTMTAQTYGAPTPNGSSPFAAAWIAGAGVAPILFVGQVFDGAAQEQNCDYDPRGINVECRFAIRAPPQVAFRFEGRGVTAVTDAALLAPGNVQGAGAVDLDRDGVEDLVLAVDFAPQRALRRTATGFVDVSRQAGIDVFGHGMGVALTADTLLISTIGGLLDFARTADGFRLRGDDSALMDRRRDVWPWQVDMVDLNGDGRRDVLQINGFSLDAENPDPVGWLRSIGGRRDFMGNFDSIFVARADGNFDERRLSYASIMRGSGRGVASAFGDLGAGHVEIALPVRRPESRAYAVALGRPDFSAP